MSSGFFPSPFQVPSLFFLFPFRMCVSVGFEGNGDRKEKRRVEQPPPYSLEKEEGSRKEGRKDGRTDGRKEGRKERKEGRKEGKAERKQHGTRNIDGPREDMRPPPSMSFLQIRWFVR
mmetsp:Transcript_14978/g.30284  ORF Transcript_14978/g.30284 Transcript_14978/m.30284 type:complete len:118 (-) Transcript_14978:565-918(-)